MGLMEKIFGDLNAKEVRKVEKIVDQIEAYDEEMQALSDDELRAKTQEFKDRLAEGETLDATCMDKFRTKSNCNQWLMKFWQLAEGLPVPRGVEIGRCFHIKDNIWDEALSSISRGRYRLICINDTIYTKDFDLQKQQVLDAFDTLLPEKSSFEL